MATTVRSIQSGGGGDYTTIAAWESAAPSLGTDIWKGEIDDNAEYNENVTLNAAGTPSSTSYLWLTGGASNRHAGVAGTGHPRIRGNTSGSHVIVIRDNWTRVEWLEIQQDSAGSSDEGIRIGHPSNTGDAPNDVLISYCIIWTNDATGQQDGIHCAEDTTAPIDGSVTIDNCIIYGFNRAQINLQQWSNNQASTWTVNVDHCTLINQSTTANSNDENAAIFVRSAHASDALVVNVYNSIGYLEFEAPTETWSAFADGANTVQAQRPNSRAAPNGSVTWNGSHNLRGDQGTTPDLDGTDNLTNSQFATDGDSETSQSSGSYVVFEDITLGTEDFRLLDSAPGNLAARNGTNRQGSEPDNRQDFSVDVTGGGRSTTGVDIGAHQFTSLSLYARLYQSDEMTPLSDEVLVSAFADPNTSMTDYVVDFTGLDTTVDKTTWDAAKLRLRWSDE